MNVSVIGRGTSAIINVLVLLKNKHQVTVFYDPNKPHINVGESTTPPIGNLICDVLGLSIHELVEKGYFSYKMGINFVDWGCKDNFKHHFYNSTLAHHFDTNDFNIFVCNLLEDMGVTFIPKKVEQHELSEFDFTINCGGWSEDEYYDADLESVNSAWLFKKNYKEFSQYHTLHLATEDGWQFGLPYPKKNIFKCGYLFNSNYISKEDARSKLPDECDVTGYFTWRPKYLKALVKNEKIAYNGNKLFFFEPLQALTLHFVFDFALLINEYLNDMQDHKRDDINQRYLGMIYGHQLDIAYHYSFGSKYKTKFWNDMIEKSKIILNSSTHGYDQKFKDEINYDIKYKNGISRLGSIDVFDHQQLQNLIK